MERGALVNEGKTKRVWTARGDSRYVIIEHKDTITAFDDPSFTKTFAAKSKYSNTTASRVFELLNAAGIPTHYVRQISDIEFLAQKCSMIPLEVVVRRYAVGSYLKRHPEYAKRTDGQLNRFETPVVEFFLKTTKGALKDSTGSIIIEGLSPKNGEEDPLIRNPHDEYWELLHPKMSVTDSTALLGKNIERKRILGGAQIIDLESIVSTAFVTLEAFFAKHDFTLIDCKVEFGVTGDGNVVIADVIDNDSWRLRDADGNDVSKQSFRDGEDLSKVENKYARVAALVENAR